MPVARAGELRILCKTAVFDAGLVTVNSGTAKFAGVVQCDTLMANAVPPWLGVSTAHRVGA
jgi:hypothetical protein